MGRKLRVRQVLVAFLEPQFQQRLADCAAGILKDVVQISGGDSCRHRDALGRGLGRADKRPQRAKVPPTGFCSVCEPSTRPISRGYA
jgi:hypothetical protein